jgi:prepilin-type processing-associated H-X9-DG protein
MMQYRLSTVFIIFFAVAATLAFFGDVGVFVAFGLLLIAFVANRINRSLTEIIVFSSIVALVAYLFVPALAVSHERERQEKCVKNLLEIGQALQRYHDIYGHYPALVIKDTNGHPLWSWRVEILSGLGHGNIFNELRKTEPWNSPYNIELLDRDKPRAYGCSIPEYYCPSGGNNNGDNSSNYGAIIGPDSAWRNNNSVSRSDLPDGGVHTPMVVEILNPGHHWAEPNNLSVEELLERIRGEHGRDNLSNHPTICNILFADGSVWSIPKDLPFPVWQRLLIGEVKSVDDLNSNLQASETGLAKVSYYADAYDRFFTLTREYGPTICSAIIWLLSVFLLFYWAVKNRRRTGLSE